MNVDVWSEYCSSQFNNARFYPHCFAVAASLQFKQKQSNLFDRSTFIIVVTHMQKQKRFEVVLSQLIFGSNVCATGIGMCEERKRNRREIGMEYIIL